MTSVTATGDKVRPPEVQEALTALDSMTVSYYANPWKTVFGYLRELERDVCDLKGKIGERDEQIASLLAEKKSLKDQVEELHKIHVPQTVLDTRERFHNVLPTLQGDTGIVEEYVHALQEQALRSQKEGRSEKIQISVNMSNSQFRLLLRIFLRVIGVVAFAPPMFAQATVQCLLQTFNTHNAFTEDSTHQRIEGGEELGNKPRLEEEKPPFYQRVRYACWVSFVVSIVICALYVAVISFDFRDVQRFLLSEVVEDPEVEKTRRVVDARVRAQQEATTSRLAYFEGAALAGDESFVDLRSIGHLLATYLSTLYHVLR